MSRELYPLALFAIPLALNPASEDRLSGSLDLDLLLRLLRGKVPTVLDEYDYTFELGKAKVLRGGNDVLFVSSGLMTMPPETPDPEASRPYFQMLRRLAEEHGLAELSMGTSQDYRVAAEEGATYIRVGSVLYGK